MLLHGVASEGTLLAGCPVLALPCPDRPAHHVPFQLPLRGACCVLRAACLASPGWRRSFNTLKWLKTIQNHNPTSGISDTSSCAGIYVSGKPKGRDKVNCVQAIAHRAAHAWWIGGQGRHGERSSTGPRAAFTHVHPNTGAETSSCMPMP